MSDTLALDLRGRLGSFELDAKVTLPAEGVTVVFGRSGSGKTTLLRAIAGLERMQGSVRAGTSSWQDDAAGTFVRPEARRIGFVFQEAALFPHLTVKRNLDYAEARASGESRPDRASVIERLGLGALLARSPGDLSGGERQRVAIARALLSNPVLLLMDEPLAALDLGARDSILGHLEALPATLSAPLLYVTHSVDEASRLGERVVWLEAGRVRAVGSPGEIFGRLDLGLSLGDEAGGLIEASVRRHDPAYALTELESAWGPVFTHRLAASEGRRVVLRARARDVSLALERETKSSIMNVFDAEVTALEQISAGETLVALGCPRDPKQALLARVMKKSADELGLKPGLRVLARVKGVSLR